MSFTPTSFYDILRGDYLTMNPMGPGALDDSPDAYYQTGGSFYYPPCTSTGAGNELETLFPTYDSFYPSYTPTPSMSSGDLSVSWGSTPTTWSGASFDDLFNPSNRQDVQRIATNDSRREQGSPPRRRRGPNRRRPGTGYAELMDKLPQEVQEALTQTYQGCCEVVVKKDISTVQKHQFSNRHCANLPPELQGVLPSFTCPAFVAMHESCRSAKHGRYDSTERHCKSCPGYKEMDTANHMYPIELTKAEFGAVQEFRKRASPDQQTYSPQLKNAISRFLEMVVLGD